MLYVRIFAYMLQTYFGRYILLYTVLKEELPVYVNVTDARAAREIAARIGGTVKCRAKRLS